MFSYEAKLLTCCTVVWNPVTQFLLTNTLHNLAKGMNTLILNYYSIIPLFNGLNSTTTVLQEGLFGLLWNNEIEN